MNGRQLRNRLTAHMLAPEFWRKTNRFTSIRVATCSYARDTRLPGVENGGLKLVTDHLRGSRGSSTYAGPLIPPVKLLHRCRLGHEYFAVRVGSARESSSQLRAPATRPQYRQSARQPHFVVTPFFGREDKHWADLAGCIARSVFRPFRFGATRGSTEL